MSTDVWSEMALVGRVARVHGLKGDVIINPETDFPESRFQPGAVVHRRTGGGIEALTVATVRFHRGRPIVRFEGIESITGAEPLAGLELRVPVASLEALPADRFYHHDLVGCRVETRSGEMVGEVDHVEGESGTSQLAVNGPRGEVLVPLAATICVGIDVGRKVIVIEPPEGLLDLNRRDPAAQSRQSRNVPRGARRPRR